MNRKVKSFRLRVDLLEWLRGYATSRESTEIAVLEAALISFKADAQTGVPELAATERPPSRERQEANKAALKFARQAAEPTQPTRHDYNMARQQQLNAAKYRQAK